MSGWGWGKQSHDAAAGAGAGGGGAGAGAGWAAGGKVAVHKVDKIDHVLNLVTRPTGPAAGYYASGGGGVERSPWDDGRSGGANKGDDINRKAEDFIKRQRSKWSLIR